MLTTRIRKTYGGRAGWLLGPVILTSVMLSVLAIAPLASLAMASAQKSGRSVRLAPVTAFPALAKRYALVIGVDAYEDRQITPLAGAGNDASALAGALVKYAGFPADQVVVLSTASGERPTRANIFRRLSNLRGVVPADGLLLVAFSGHGIERGGRGYLLPSDAQSLNDVSLLEDTAVSVDRVRDLIRATGVGQVLLLVDACRNDPTAGKGDSDNPMTAAFGKGFSFDVANREVQAFATLYAAEVGQRAFEDSAKRRGYFSQAVVDGLAGKAANPRGEVTLAGLVAYVQQAVPRRIALDLGAGKKQRPFATIEGYLASDLIVAMASKDAGGAVDAPATGPVATVPALPSVETVLENYYRAVGGSKLLTSLATSVMKGTVEFTYQGKKYAGTTEVYTKRPRKQYMISTIAGAETKEVYDGKQGWTYGSSTGTSEMPPQQLSLRDRMAAWEECSIETIRQLYPTIRVLERDRLGERDVYVVEAIPSDGRSETYWFDARTGLLLSREFPFESGRGEGVVFKSRYFFDDYTEINGVMVPLTIRSASANLEFLIKFDLLSIKYNVPVDDKLFTKPK